MASNQEWLSFFERCGLTAVAATQFAQEFSNNGMTFEQLKTLEGYVSNPANLRETFTQFVPNTTAFEALAILNGIKNLLPLDTNSRPATPFESVQDPLPTADHNQIHKFLFYISENGVKSCVVCVEPHYLVTFRHGSHVKFTQGTALRVHSETTDAEHDVKVVHICEKLDFVVLRSETAVVDKGPPIAEGNLGEAIFICGYGNDFQTRCFTDGCINTDQLQYFFGGGSSYIGPFMLGTVQSRPGDSGGSCWSSQGLVGLNLGVTKMCQKPHSVAIDEAAIYHPRNYMVPSRDIMEVVEEEKRRLEEEKRRSEQRKLTKIRDFLIDMEGIGKFK